MEITTTTYLPLMAGDSMLFMLFLVAVGILYLGVRFLHLASPASTPTLIYKRSPITQKLIESCPLLSEPYVPPLLWGKSGHLQTFVYAKLGRVKTPFQRGKRCYITMPDDATMSYDIFEPIAAHPYGDFTILICPGIGSSSESLYVCTCVDYARHNGYRVAVLNHLGALKNIKLTAPRIYTYGGTDEYAAMVDEVLNRYPQTKLIACGFSMGGNIVMKYLGEKPERQQNFIAGISCCQGYDAEKALSYMLEWTNLRRAYIWVMTLHQKKLLREHFNELFGPESIEKYGKFDTEKIFKATSLVELDDAYECKISGFKYPHLYYRSHSCKRVMKNIKIPMFLLNSLDDPIIPSELLDDAREYASQNPNVVLCLTEHGGHLGYFEGDTAVPESLTWLDKIVVQVSDAAASANVQDSLGSRGEMSGLKV